MLAPREAKSFVSNLKTSGSALFAKLKAMSFEAEVERQANSVPPLLRNSMVRPRSFMPRQYVCGACALGCLAATARSMWIAWSMK